MAKPTPWPLPYQICFYIVASPLILLLSLVFILLSILLIILGLPYVFARCSVFYGMRKSRDQEPVRVYLEHFKNIHPRLINYHAAVFDHAMNNGWVLPDATKFWPTMSRESIAVATPFVGGTSTHYQFTYESSFFAILEGCYFDREQLYKFLQKEVERNVNVHQNIKTDFRRVQKKMKPPIHTLGRPLIPLERVLDKLIHVPKRSGAEWTMPTDIPAEVQTIRVSSTDDLDWLLCSGALIVPQDRQTRSRLDMLARFGLILRIKEAVDLEKGSTRWLMFDDR